MHQIQRLRWISCDWRLPRRTPDQEYKWLWGDLPDQEKLSELTGCLNRLKQGGGLDSPRRQLEKYSDLEVYRHWIIRLGEGCGWASNGLLDYLRLFFVTKRKHYLVSANFSEFWFGQTQGQRKRPDSAFCEESQIGRVSEEWRITGLWTRRWKGRDIPVRWIPPRIAA